MTIFTKPQLANTGATAEVKDEVADAIAATATARVTRTATVKVAGMDTVRDTE